MKTASVVLCAGKGSRMKSKMGKMLHPLCGRPLCYWSVKNATTLSQFPPVVVVGHKASEVERSLTELFPKELSFALQSEQNGTGGAVLAAMERLPQDADQVLILYGDTPLLSLSNLEALLRLKAKVCAPIAMLTAKHPSPTGYGRILRNESEHISGIIEEGDASSSQREIQEINPGVYVFDKSFLEENCSKLSKENARKEYQLVDLINNYIRQGQSSGPIFSIEIPYEETHGINDREQLALADKILRSRLIKQWMMEGVTFIDPEQTYLDDGVTLAPDCVIYPGVHLRGATRIGSDVVIENGCVLTDTVVEGNAHIYPYSVCQGAFIGPKCEVGPFARLRAGAYLEESVKIGNFVEVKKTRLKNGAKANHLSYLGDAVVGKNTNVGAGTITCNFDGAQKYQTTLGDNVFVGSNVTLVAPLTIADQAYVAAGSTLTDSVPAKALAFGRARQVNKEGRASEKPRILEK